MVRFYLAHFEKVGLGIGTLEARLRCTLCCVNCHHMYKYDSRLRVPFYSAAAGSHAVLLSACDCLKYSV